MKIAKSPEKHTELMAHFKNDTESMSYFVALESKPNAEKLHSWGYDDWLRVPKTRAKYFIEQPVGAKKGSNSEENLRKEYEAFVFGYLYYYEQHVISPMEKTKKDYKIYFDWGGKTEKGEKYYLIIYLNSMENQPEYTDYKRHVDPKYKTEYQTMMYQTSIIHSYIAPPTSLTDPPKPTGPPPPPSGRRHDNDRDSLIKNG